MRALLADEQAADDTQLDVDVMVVGAGAAGLAAAITLGRYGIPTLLTERRTATSTLPRATAISTRSMELLRAWGLDADVLAGGVDADVLIWECETLAAAAEGTAHEVGYPSRTQASVISPTTPGAVPQDWLESTMRTHLATLPSVRCDLGFTLTEIDNSADAVTATMHNAVGESRTVRAKYLVAADGAHSTVRGALGVRMLERDGAYGGVQVVFRAPLWDILGDLRYALYAVTTPSSPGLFLPAGRPNRWVYGAALAPDDERAPGVDPNKLVEAIRRGAGVDNLGLGIERIGSFHSPGQIAEHFRVGRTFLVGDAAHRVTPRGGTGMNTALQDGHDIGWKLAWTLQGWANPSLLDTYEPERRLVAEHNLARSTDLDGSRRPVVDELNVDLGGRIRHAWLPSTITPTSTLDLLGPGWTLFTGPSMTVATPPLPSPAPVTVRAVDAMTARTLGISTGGALLVRPDGVPISHTPDGRGNGVVGEPVPDTEPTPTLVGT